MQPDTQLPKPPAVGVYKALLQQSGTSNPDVIVLQNTIGNIIWTRTNTGVYEGTLSDAFPLNKTLTKPIGHSQAIFMPMGDSLPLEYAYSIFRLNNNTIRLETFDSATFSHVELSTITSYSENFILLDIEVYNINIQNSIS